MSIFDSLKSSAVGLLGDLAGNFLIGRPNADRASAQSLQNALAAFGMSRDAYRSRYRDTVADMKAAGLNPILAASSGFNVGTAPQMSSAQAFMAPNPSYSASQSAMQFAQAGQADAQTKKTIQEVGLVVAKTDETFANIHKIRSEANLADARERETNVRVRQITKEILHTVSKIRLTDAETEKVSKQINVLNTDLAYLEKKAEAYKGPAGDIYAVIRFVRELLGINVNILPGLMGR